MDIADAATYFDQDPVADGYTLNYLFDAQTASFDDSSGDGATNRRRILSLAPGLALPTRRVIEMYGDLWLVGTGTPDGFYGEVIRQQYTMKRVTDAFTLYTPGAALAQVGGLAVYGHRHYFRDVTDNVSEAKLDTFWNIFLAPGEPAGPGSILKDARGGLYRVRNDYLPVEGLRVCQSDTLDAGSRVTVALDTGVYDPVTDSFSSGSSAVPGILLNLPQAYHFRHMTDGRELPGDRILFLPGSSQPTTGGTLSIAGVKWRVVTVQPELDAKAVHMRLA